ncbi:MAG: hypothetical protein HPY83_17620 [Anaerolineae bacterium]|nr:hypothetical protein [Anaerolineae bacterium]
MYHYYASDPYRRDSGAYVRSAILQAWRPLARADDVPLLERALLTYEFPPPGRTEGAASLRAAALVTLSDLEPGLAAYHAVRLLADKHNSAMSGEPGVTAARVLASQGEMLPLYACAVAPTGVRVEVVSECLRSLVRMPGSLLPALVEQYQRTSDEIVLVGLFDLILGHEDGAKQTPFLLSFLQETHLHDAYRYLVTVIVAGRHAHLLSDLIALARHESDRLKRRALAEALSLLAGDPEVDAVLADLQKDGHDGR